MLSFSKIDEVYIHEEFGEVTRYNYFMNFRGSEMPLTIVDGDVLFDRSYSDLFGISGKIYDDWLSLIYGNKKNTIPLVKLNSLIKEANLKNKSSRGNVYLISDGTYTKIGMTAGKSKLRLSSLQCGNALELKVIFEYFTKNRNKEEQRLHNKYAHLNMQGEWFNLSEKEILEIKMFGIVEHYEKDDISLSIEEYNNILKFCHKQKMSYGIEINMVYSDIIIDLLPSDNEEINRLMCEEDNHIGALLYAHKNNLIDLDNDRHKNEVNEILFYYKKSIDAFNEAKSMVDNIMLIDLV